MIRRYDNPLSVPFWFFLAVVFILGIVITIQQIDIGMVREKQKELQEEVLSLKRESLFYQKLYLEQFKFIQKRNLGKPKNKSRENLEGIKKMLEGER